MNILKGHLLAVQTRVGQTFTRKFVNQIRQGAVLARAGFFSVRASVPLLALGFFAAGSMPLHAASIGIATINGFLHDSTGLLAIYDNTSANFFSTLNTNNIGTFGWTYRNTGTTALTDVRFFGFLDADIDRALNGASNEYGQVISQMLPPGAPTDAIGWNSFQIDEPGFVSGTIFDNLLAGFLDDTNHCPPGTQNDVSLAVGFDIGNLNPGQSFTATYLISGSNIGGLSQTDPDSNYTFYFNGFSSNPAASIPVLTPEPGTGSLLAISMLLIIGFLARKTRCAPVIILLVTSIGTAQAQMQLTPAASAAGFKLTQFADGFPNVFGIGPVGIGFPNSGGVLVTDYPGNIRLFPTNTDGQHANTITPAQNLGSSSGAGIAKANGHIFAGDQTAGSLLQLNDDGTTSQVIVSSGLGNDAGVAANPTNGHIFVSVRSGFNGIVDINPVTKTFTTFVNNVSADGLTFSPDGSVLYAAVISSDHIIGYRVSDGTQVFDSGFISSLDGCAVGTGSLAGLLFVNTNDGRLVQVTLATSVQTVIASGGSRGDLVTVDPDGTLLLTQTDSILRVTAPSGGGFGGTPPVISDVLARFKEESADIFWSPPVLPTGSQSTGSISVCYNCQNSFGIPPQTDGPVFIIQNTGTAPITNARLTINPTSGVMDAFLIGSIAPGGTFLLTPGVSNDGGTGHTFFAVTGSVLDTSDVGPDDNSTQFRLTGTQGLNSVDTGIFTPAATAGPSNDGTVANINFLGGPDNADAPCNNCFGPKVVATLFLPPNSTVSSYNLYRRTDSVPFSKIQSGLTSTHYTDFNLTDGTTYYYVVRWVDSNGIESPNSTEISATPTSIASLIAHSIPPTILSNPVVLATVGSVYSYAVNSSNPVPGDVLTFSLPTAPAGMTIDSAKGVISWIPAAAQTGTVTVKVRVQDLKGNFASQMYQITVQAAPPSAPPVITSIPVLSATASQIYNYQVLATDPNTGAVLTYSVPTAPAGVMMTSNSGFLQWVPTASQVGSQNITVKVQDQFGLSTAQSFTVTVASAPVLSPVITSAPVLTAVATQFYTYQVTATDPNTGQTLAFSLPSAPTGVTISAATGLIQWTPTVAQEGPQNVVVRVQDTLGRFATQLFTVTVSSPLLPPTITIDSPVTNSTITQVTSIIGSISNPNGKTGGPLNWTLAILKPGAASYQTIASGTGPVTNVAIGQIDPTMLSNNVYPVRVTATIGPLTRTANLSYNVAGNLKLGQFTVQFTDLSIPVAGIPITITRRYDSLDVSTGEFGAGWRLALPGQVADSAGGNPYTVLTRIYVTRPDGTRVGFTFSPIFSGSFFLPTWSPGFMPDPGVTDTLTVPSDQLFYSGGGFYTLSGAYDPTLFTLTTTQGVQYLIDENAGLQKITDTNGNTLTVTPGGLVSSTGVTVAFQRDSKNRITKIAEPGSNPGVLQYSYDANGNLSTVTDQSGNITNYFYENTSFPNYLTKIQDPLGRPVLRNVFNAAGQFIAQCDANGNLATLAGCITYNPNSIGRTQTIVDARGFETDLVFDLNGNVLTQQKWLDSTDHLDTLRTYDGNGNVLTIVDPAGNKTTNTYDALGNLLTTTDPLGGVTTNTYNSCNQILTTTDPSGNVTTNTYDANCNLLSSKNALGAVATYKYNSFGEPTDYTDPLGSHWSWSYDSVGFLSTSTDPFGNKTSFKFGPTGDLLTRIDRNGRRIDSQYDNVHRLIQETWATAPPHVISYSYDSTGQMSSASDPNSTIALTYTNLGQLSTISNQGSPNGAPSVTTSYSYDTAGNMTQVQDSLGGATAYTYDALSRLTSATQHGTGINSKRADFQYDKASFLTELIRSSDLLGTNQIANTLFETDCNGCPGRVTAIRHRRASNNTVIDDITFTRDKLRDIVASSDADGSHSYTYDSVRRLLTAAHSNPVQPSEAYTYDLAGNRTASQLSTSYFYSYASAGTGNRLLQDQQFSYQYDNEGNQVRKTNRLSGAYTIYQYDYYNRLVQATQYTSAGSATGSYQQVYDALGRRQQVIDQGVSNWVFYAGLNPTLLLDNTGTLVARRFYLPSSDKLLAEDQGPTTYWPLLDQVGTPRDLITSSGALVDHVIMDSFGRVLARNPSGANSVIGFTGREKLSDGDVFMISRQYDPQTGIFRQEDQLRPFAYSYAAGNPLSYRDPSGGEELEEYAVIASEATSLICGTGLPTNPSAGAGIFAAQFVSGQVLPSAMGFAGFFIGRSAVTLDFLAAFLGEDNNTPLASRWQNAVNQAQSAAINPRLKSTCDAGSIIKGPLADVNGYAAGVQNGVEYLNSLQPQ